MQSVKMHRKNMPTLFAELMGEASWQSSIGLAVIDPAGYIICANPAFCSMLALPNSELLLDAPFIELLTDTFPTKVNGLAQALKQFEASTLTLHLDLKAEPLNFLIASATNDQRTIVVNYLQKSKNNPETPPIDHIDPLTGLGNRKLLDDLILQWQPRPIDQGSLAAIMIDLDRFKQVNDTLGHAAGDALLKLVAKRIKSTTRAEDQVIRMGGDEFVILHAIGTTLTSAQAIAQRVVELISRPFIIDGQQINIGASAGIAALNHGTEAASDLLKHADLAMYNAKSNGKGNVKLFESAFAERALNRRNLEIDLRRALSLNEFKLMYQPQVNMADGSLQGFEALIRWQSPTRGFVSPADFIPLAEEIGEIHAIGEWVLRTACKEAVQWDGHFTVAVNVSPIQFDNEKIIDIIKSALSDAGLPPQRLEIEITEGILMKDYQSIHKLLWDIKLLGVGIAMDDFGTGYSSLSYLSSFPFTKLKIDQSFVRGEDSTKSKALVQAIINLGESLSMKTIAEGVETVEQFKALAEKGCMGAQGYLISRPITPLAITEFVLNQKNPQKTGDSYHAQSPLSINLC